MLNPPLLTSGKSTWAPFIFLPDILFIGYLLINYFCLRSIMNIFYFYTSTYSFKSPSFMYRSVVDLCLMILPILITTFRAIIESWQLQAFITTMLKERTVLMIFVFFLNPSPFTFFLILPMISFLTHLLFLLLSLPLV